MSEDLMEYDSSVSTKAKSLETLIGGSLPASLLKLSSSSRGIPTDKDFHFFYNFEEFKRPIDEITASSQSVLETIGDSEQVWGKALKLTGDIDGDDAYDWLVNVNDEIYERFDVSMDEFERIRKKEEEFGRPLGPVVDENGFQMVYGRKKKTGGNSVSDSAREGGSGLLTDVKVAERDKKASATSKAKVPFHIPTIKKPQEEYNILVNNANQPFEHVWLERSEDSVRFIHPLEKCSVMDFVDKNIGETKPAKPLPMEETPFKLVENVKDLKELATKLRSVEEFAVDLEHNQYRSFQGLTCLLQISTRAEDYIVDTFKLRVHIGPYLREIFKDPQKKKVMHGADRDIVWLQRDFGIYICNLFDTGQASRVLKLERNSLEFLLQHYCGVTANKEYQNAEWRIRPLPVEMIRYAREDTHYLLYIYDVMRLELETMPKEDEQSDSSLVEVYKRSYDVCAQLYEKELLTENTYLHIYGLQGAGFDASQLAIVAGLCQWRDAIARAEDESTGYVLPNKTLLEIGKEMPVTTSKLRRLLKSKHPYIERNIDTVICIIRQSMQNTAAFEAASQSLKEGRPGTVSYNKNIETSVDGSDLTPKVEVVASPISKEKPSQIESSFEGLSSVSVDTNERRGLAAGLFGSTKASVSVQMSKKQSSSFGALLGCAPSKRKFGTDTPNEEIKLEQIRSSVSLPFHSFTDKAALSKAKADAEKSPIASGKPEDVSMGEASDSKPENVIMLDDGSDKSSETQSEVSGSKSEEPETVCKEEEESVVKTDAEDEQMSLSELSSNFQNCFKQMNQSKKEKKLQHMARETGVLNIKAFDYEAARIEMKSAMGGKGGKQGEENANRGGKTQKKGFGEGGVKQKGDGTTEFGQGKRRQAFPASGNRSMTFLN